MPFFNAAPMQKATGEMYQSIPPVVLGTARKLIETVAPATPMGFAAGLMPNPLPAEQQVQNTNPNYARLLELLPLLLFAPAIIKNISKLAKPDELARMAGTARKSIGTMKGTVRQTSVTKAAIPRLRKNERILDFGAGVQIKKPKSIKELETVVAEAEQTKLLRELGFDAHATDLPESIERSSQLGTGIVRALEKGEQFDTVLASNVLNVSPKREILDHTIKEIKSRMGKSGRAIVNYPKDPRRMPEIKGNDMEKILKENFKSVELIGGTRAEPVFEVFN